jgi:pimeloyl-ACP methyl ester carboxylesterase
VLDLDQCIGRRTVIEYGLTEEICAVTAETRTVRVVLPPHGGAGAFGVPAERLREIVRFAHGSAGSRLRPCNKLVAQALQNAGLATLLFEQLTATEPASRANVFGSALVADQLSRATTWIQTTPPVRDSALDYFGTSTGTAAPLLPVSSRPDVRAIVSHGGRLGPASNALADVTAPTFLVVGGDDTDVLPLNQAPGRRLRCERHVEVVPGARRLFEEASALEAVVALARDWFQQHLTTPHVTEQI